MDLDLNLSFALDDEDDILNATIRDSNTGSIMYTLETPNYAEGILTTTATRTNQTDGTTRIVFKILWKGGKGLDDGKVVLNNRTSEEISIREIFRDAPGGDVLYVPCRCKRRCSQTFDFHFFDSGAMFIEDVEYRWKTKGMGSKVVVSQMTTFSDLGGELNSTPYSHQLTTKSNTTVVKSHSKRRSGLFRKPRNMGLEISGAVALAVDVILLTFIFVWEERKKVTKLGAGFLPDHHGAPPSPTALHWVSDK